MGIRTRTRFMHALFSARTGAVLVAAGVALLLTTGAFYGYRAYATIEASALDVSAGADGTARSMDAVGHPLVSRYAASQTATLNPAYWGGSLWAGPSYETAALPDGFRPVRPSDIAPKAPADHIAIPAIGVDSPVRELEIMDFGDSRQYETPKHVVGHIPETANPGEAGNGWLFGHLESPIRGEGNVFQGLPRVATLLQRYIETGENPVYVTLSGPDGGFLYEVVETRIVHKDDLALYGSDGATITLVTCYPRFVYDQRVVVTARLVGVRG
ncbi:MAG: sortase [SAR202 cluster bacterium]|nr:sortase [SAR202 cluster bacterium]